MLRTTIARYSSTVKMQLHLQKPLMIDAGRYVNLWIRKNPHAVKGVVGEKLARRRARRGLAWKGTNSEIRK